VRGMVAISPPEEGNLLPTWVAARMIRRLMMSLIADYIAPFLTMAMRGGAKARDLPPGGFPACPGEFLSERKGAIKQKAEDPAIGFALRSSRRRQICLASSVGSQ